MPTATGRGDAVAVAAVAQVWRRERARTGGISQRRDFRGRS
jgi:hypothetical protein